MTMTIDRRQFLKAGAAGSLTIGFSLGLTATPASAATVPAAKIVAKDQVDAFLVMHRDGRVEVYVGKVDLGTGTRTALSQIAAEELDVPFSRITMHMGDTGTTPDQWLTGANLTIQQGGGELRRACGTARAALLGRAAERLKVAATDLVVADGVVRVRQDASKSVTYGELIGDGRFELKINDKIQLKAPADYKVIGKSIARVDIPDKVTGKFEFVQDVRVPGMLHARVIRPDDIGANLLAFDDSAARKVRGYVQTVRKGNFLAVLASDEWSAIKAAREVSVNWGAAQLLPEQSTVFQTWRQRHVAKEEATQKAGDIAAGLSASAKRIKASYEFAVQTHASLGPSCAVADFKDGKLLVWSASQATHSMMDELAGITGVPRNSIRLVYCEGSGCYGRNGHEDATADAALLATLVGKPVRVQWMRDDETARAPKSPPRAMDFEAGLDAQGNVIAWKGDFHIALNHIAAFKPLDFPLLAATDIGQSKPGNWVGFLFQNAGQPYPFPNVAVNTRHISEAFFRSSHLRSPGRIENSFANESFMDELAFAAKADPAEYRLRVLKDPRGLEALRAVLKKAGWQTRVGHNAAGGAGDVLKGRGVSYVRYNNATTYVAAVAEVEVQRKTGEVRVTRVCVSHDCGQIINPDGLINQIEGGVIQTVSRTLMEQVNWTRARVTSVDWASYPILRFHDAPKVEVVLIDRPTEQPWGAGEPTPTAIPAAVANAIFDATGARLRSVPITPEKVKAAMAEGPARA
ncbi:MAG: xanthine dehydrogenase family protein molybdopterin-binding subunit [Betaproteobacteria bacterium]|nr:xanthine dehydrogenase family protein molybdopterin-binding subunit [Betaproteobacteria bacterium]